MLDWNQEFCVKLVLCFVHLLWQGLIIGAAFAILMGVLRNRSPQSRHACGLICLLIFALCVPVTYLTTSDTVSLAPEVLAASSQTIPIVQPPAQETLPLATEASPVVNTGTLKGQATSEKSGLAVAKRSWDFRRAAPLLIAAYFVGVLFFAARLACGVYLSRVYRRLATPVTQH